MKYKLESLEGLSEEQKALYQEKDGAFYLIVEGLPQSNDGELDGLKKKVDELLTEKKAEQKKRQEAEEQARQEAEQNARKKGDIEALEKSWADKLTQRETELSGQNEALKNQVYKLTVGQTAQSLAGELALKGSESVLLPHIISRLQIENSGDEVKVRVLDLQGKLSALTLDDLKTEFRNNAAFKPLIVAVNSSGGGATGGGDGGGAAKKPKEMNTQERIEWQRNDPQGFKQALDSGQFN